MAQKQDMAPTTADLQNRAAQPPPGLLQPVQAEAKTLSLEDTVEQDLERHLYQQALDGEQEALRRAEEAENQTKQLQAILSGIVAQMSPGNNDESHKETADAIQTMLRRPGTVELEALLAGLGATQPTAAADQAALAVQTVQPAKPHEAQATATDTAPTMAIANIQAVPPANPCEAQAAASDTAPTMATANKTALAVQAVQPAKPHKAEATAAAAPMQNIKQEPGIAEKQESCNVPTAAAAAADETTPEELAELAERARLAREAHNTYMRYYRSIRR